MSTQEYYAPVIVKPHLPQVGQWVEISSILSLKIAPGVGEFVKLEKIFCKPVVFLTTFSASLCCLQYIQIASHPSS